MRKLNETIGELFIVGFPGTDPSAARELIQQYHVGGIILFSRNIHDAGHARTVCEELQELRRQVSDSPLFIAIDQEGGCVCRITDGVTVFPGAMALGAIGTEQLTRQVAEITATDPVRHIQIVLPRSNVPLLSRISLLGCLSNIFLF